MFRRLSFSIITLLFLLLLNFPVVAQTSDELLRKISELESEVATLRGQEKTLTSQVEILNNQIAITKLNIESTDYKVFPVYYPVGQGMRNIKLAKEDMSWIIKNFL
jgi:uncharacterized protein YlxW (UPF0749 family)